MNMYTILHIEYKMIITYLMIIEDDLCSDYTFLTYDFSKNIFVNESFNTDSFKTINIDDIPEMMEKIDKLINNKSLKSLMYEDINEYENMSIESIHIPENYQFK